MCMRCVTKTWACRLPRAFLSLLNQELFFLSKLFSSVEFARTSYAVRGMRGVPVAMK
jgi:hypothetical protein